MLDLLRHGLPLGAGAFPAWLREKAQELLMAHLRRLRRGEDAAPQLSQPQAAAWLEGMPPVYGGTVTTGLLVEWFGTLGEALAWQAERELTTPEKWLASLGEGWQQLGTLCFHLAENGGEGAESHPFAFLATFIHRAGQDGKPRHAPLALARQLYANDVAALTALLRPLQQAAAGNSFLHELINSGGVYKPCAWGPRQAYDFLESLPLLEQAGIETRMVNLWQSRPPRVELEVQLQPAGSGEGQKPDRAPALNISTLLRFSPRVVLGNYELTEAELEELMAGEDGLIRFRGEWVRLDREKLEKLLNSWRQATRMAAGGIPLLAGLRWLLGKHSTALPNIPPPEEDGMRAIAAPALQEALKQLCLSPREPQLPEKLASTLRPYQKDGVRFLQGVTEAGFGACLADDMGLGKTLQVIAWLAHLHATGALAERAALIVAPASLLTNWQDELRKFAPQLNTLVLHPYALNRQDCDYLQKNPQWLLKRAHVALTTYGMATRLAELLAGEPLPARPGAG